MHRRSVETARFEDGKRPGEVAFKGVPVFDGMATAYGLIYVSTRKGKVFCFGRK